jgi:hypothetical protein
MDDREKYLRWLEEMWDAQKFDVHGSAEREEKKTDEILEMFRGPDRLSKRRVEEPPEFRPRRTSDERRRPGRPQKGDDHAK